MRNERKLLKKVIMSFMLLVSIGARGQMVLTPNLSANALIDRLVGTGIVYLNPSLVCPSGASGKFDQAITTPIQLDSGIVLTSGRVQTNALGFGVNGTGAQFASVSNGVIGGDANLAVAAGVSNSSIRDLCKLEFDFIPTGDTIQFRYRFGSEEYPEYNCSDYNDIFAFFISGPGYAVPTNLALVPGTNIPVTINSINDGTVTGGIGNPANCSSMGPGSPFTGLYVNNGASSSITYDGLTKLLTAKAAVTPCSTYHMKFAIADVSDHQYDSGVFLEAGSFSSEIAAVVSVTSTNTISGANPFAIEGCTPAVITLARPVARPYPQVVSYTLSGSALNGVDILALPGSVTIPAFSTSTSFSVTAIPDGIIEGTETLILSINGSLCGNTVTEVLTLDIQDVPVYLMPDSDTLCAGSSGVLNITLLPPNPSLSFTWLPVSGLNTSSGSTVIASPLNNTTYTVTANYPGCPPRDSLVTVIIEPVPVTQITPTNPLCAGLSNGQLSVNTSAGPGLLWTLLPSGISGNAPISVFPNLGPGIYTLNLQTAANCNYTYTSALVSPVNIQWTQTQLQSPSCFTSNNGSIMVQASGGTGSISYTLMPGTITNSTGQFSGLQAGTYTLIAIDVQGCSHDTIINLSSPPPVLFSSASVSSSGPCAGQNNGSIQVLATGGTGSINYLLVPGGISQTIGVFNGLSPQAYTIMATDAQGCTMNTSLIVNEPPAIQWTSINGQTETCFGLMNGQIQVQASGGTGSLNYTLQPGGISNATGLFIGLTPGNYTVVVADASGCSINTQLVLNVVAPLLFTAVTPTPLACNTVNTGNIQVMATGGTGLLSFQLQPGILNNTTGNFGGLAPGIYTVVVSDAQGCSVQTQVTLNQLPALNIQQTQVTPVLCNGQSNGQVQIAANGGSGIITYTLNPGAMTNTSGLFTGLASNTYTISMSDALGCQAQTVMNITQPPILQWTNLNSTAVSCFGGNNGQIQIQANGGTGVLNYTLLPGAVNNITGQFNSLPASTYTLQVTDANACTLQTSILLSQPSVLQIAQVQTIPITCFGLTNGSIVVQANGGTGLLNYLLQPGALQNTTGVFAGIGAGSYTVQVTDANGCTTITSLILNQPASLQWTSINAQSVDCFGANSGSIQVQAVGGTGTIMYNLNPGFTNATGLFTNLLSGLYNVQATDANGCTLVTQINLTQPPALQFNSLVATNPICRLDQNGMIQATAIGGAPPYSWSLNAGSWINSANFTALGSGVYTLYMKDINGCLEDTTVTLTPQSQLQWGSLSVQHVSCYGDSNGQIQWTANGGILPYQYLVNGSISSPGLLTGLTAGGYGLMVTDSLGCVVDTLLSISQPLQPLKTLNLQTGNNKCHGDSAGFIYWQVFGGTPPYLFSLNGGVLQSSPVFNSLQAGIYSMQVKDIKGCLKDTIIQIFEPLKPIQLDSIQIQPISCKGLADAIATSFISGGTPPYYYTINGLSNPTQGQFSGLQQGTYFIQVTDSLGCQFDFSFSIQASEKFIHIQIDSMVSRVCKGDKPASIDWSCPDGYPPYGYTVNGSWLDTLSKLDNLNSGVYQIQLTDSRGCQADTSVQILNSSEMNLEVNTTSATCAGEGMDGSATALVNAGNPPFMFLWSGFSGSGDKLTSIPMGEYQVIVQDAAQCRDSVQFEIGYIPCCQLSIPNAFSPNRDGLNDAFRILPYGSLLLEKFEIYNRWGNKVFSTNLWTDSWDGTFLGADCESGTYYYIVLYKCDSQSNTQQRKGDITLIR